MSLAKAELILHPVRLRILQTLTADPLTTQQIDQQLPDVPTSSIYRHLRLLLDNGMIEVAETQQVRGVQEKAYRLVQAAYLNAEEIAGLSAEAHVRYFAAYVVSLLQDFSNYVTAVDPNIDFAADGAGYTEIAFWATPQELMEMFQAMNQAMLPWLQLGPGNGRHKHKFATISHPLPAVGAEGGQE